MEERPEAAPSHVIREGDCAVLKRDEVLKAVAVLKRRKIIFEKQWFYLDNAIGHNYGSTFEVTNGGNLQLKKRTEEASTETKEAGADNRNIVDDGKSQKLTHDDIKALKDKGIKGQEIVQQLVENSTTFRDKTEFSQDKYIKKKKKKYEAVITIVKPTTHVLSTMYYAREPGKINHLRYDTLAQMLTWGNVRAGNKMIIMETCAGLVLGAVMERMGGYGSIIQLYPGEGPARAATNSFGFPESFFHALHEFPLSKVNDLLSGTFSTTTLPQESDECVPVVEESNGSLDGKHLSGQEADTDCSTEVAMESSQPEEQEIADIPPEGENNKAKGRTHDRQKKEEKRKKLIETAALLKGKDADGADPPPLLECYTKLREKGGVINLNLSETWLRNYQVLPDRSHPKLMMSAGGGYLLTGITVTNESIKTGDYSEQRAEEPASKKQKLQEHP
ncbi:hypothetical protein lerEdw1_019251 [Lerista edwardsae]|nr:hypothetical protein lerEdw1_019251 [Lerista edwardsae]